MTVDTPVVTIDLDRLAERVERAAQLVSDLRAMLAQRESENAELVRQLEETSQKLQGHEPSALVAELTALRKDQREWLAERKDVAGRIEALLRKLERLES